MNLAVNQEPRDYDLGHPKDTKKKRVVQFLNPVIQMDLYPKYQINRVLILIRCIMRILYENGEFYMESVYCLGYINI